MAELWIELVEDGDSGISDVVIIDNGTVFTSCNPAGSTSKRCWDAMIEDWTVAKIRVIRDEEPESAANKHGLGREDLLDYPEWTCIAEQLFGDGTLNWPR